MQIQSLIKYGNDQVKKIKCQTLEFHAGERGVFILHTLTSQNLGFHTLKI